MKNIIGKIEKNCDFVHDFIENIRIDTLEISQLDVDLVKQHIRELYDAFIAFEKMIEADAGMEISFEEDEIADVDDFLRGVDEDMKEIYEELEKTDDGDEAVLEPDAEQEIAEEKTESEEIVEEEVEEKAEEEIPEEVAPDPPADEEESGQKDVQVSPEEEVPEEKTEVQETKIKDEVSPETTHEKPEKKEKTVQAKDNTVKTLFDLFEDSATESLQDKVSRNSIADIREAIGINEKFRFINQLFRGDMNEYNKVIDKLNTLKTMDEADTFLITYKVRYEWDEEGDVYREFIGIVERRYI